jgi:hypothetical protein
MNDQPLDETQRHQRTERMPRVERPDDQPPAHEPVTRPEPARPRARAIPPGYLVLWLVALASLAANLLILSQLAMARRAASAAVSGAAAVVSDLQDTTLTYTIPIDETIVFAADLPVQASIPVHIQQTLPIDTVVTVPVDAGPLGTLPLRVPIQANVPVDIADTIEVNQAFHVETAVPVSMEVPVRIPVAETPLLATLQDVEAQLRALAAELSGPIVPLPELR